MHIFNLPQHQAHALEALMYLAQTMTYGAAFWACRKHGHPTHHTYLASCAIYGVLSLILLVSIA